ncbi:MAG: ribosomal-protein-alanine acetyltransferase [Nocardioidaceae bacterium]|nr:ribosomal-protein-alanine acetyltransferase [Nocardioidaceae bacterium]
MTGDGVGRAPLVTLRPASVSDLVTLGDIEQRCMGPDAWSREALAAELGAETSAAETSAAETRAAETRAAETGAAETGADEGGVRPTRYAVVAERPGGVVVGYAVLLAVATTADVLRVAVDPAHRGRGVGRALLADLLAEASRRGCDAALLEVGVPNSAATAMYRAAGFTEIGRRPRYYAGGTDASVMRLPL